jgi:hypothetical protein
LRNGKGLLTENVKGKEMLMGMYQKRDKKIERNFRREK